MSLKDIVEGAVSAILKFFITKKSGDAFTDQVEIIYSIDKLLHDESLKHLNVERAVIVKAHNDGTEMMPLSYKYLSVIYEDYRWPFSSIREKYKGIAVDKEYILMISDMYQNKQVEVTTSDMKQCLMKDIFLTEHVVYSQMFFLKHTKKGYWYLAVGTSVEGERFNSPTHRNELFLVVNKIRKLLKAY